MTHLPESAPGPRDHCPFIPVFGAPQRMFVRGLGTELWDSDGRRYLDFLAGIAVVSLGHANPVVAKAISEQASVLLHVSNYFANPVATRAAVAVDRVVGGGGQVFFCNSGAEANEAAIKLARRHGGRGRHVVVSALGSFHGRTLAALAATGQPAKHEPFQPMPEGFRHVPYGDAAALEASLDASVGAVLLEPIQGEGGVVPPPPGYLAAVQRMCRERGILFMLDEVQTGCARTGRWFAFQHDGLEPDVVCLAKGLGNGMPVGAVWARREVAASFVPGDHGSTFSGTAIATAAVVAVLEEMARIDAPGRAVRLGEMLASALSSIPGVRGVRGRGLLLAAEVAGDAKDVAARLLERGLVVNAVTPTALRLAPPLTVTEDEVAEAVGMVREVLQ
jgi:predicted acetylornithine/succinylornithine family transaminase